MSLKKTSRNENAATTGKRPPQRIPRTERMAFHAAGHAVMQIEQGIPVASATIYEGKVKAPRLAGRAKGNGVSRRSLKVLDEEERLPRDLLEGVVMSMLAGFAAEEIRSGRDVRGSSGEERGDAYALLFEHVGSHDEAVAYLKLLAIRTRQRLRGVQLWPRVECVASALLERKRLTARQVLAALSEHEVIQEAPRLRTDRTQRRAPRSE